MKAVVKPVLLLCLLGCLTGRAAGEDLKEGGEIARVKAVYVYHFASFAQWPQERAAAPLKNVRLCVVGGGETVAQLTKLDGQDLGDGRLLEISPVRLEQIVRACQMLFIGDAPRFTSDPAWIKLRGEPVLSVSDQPGFAQKGGMIEMFLRDDKVRMRINLGMARTAGISLSSKLLRLAEIVDAP